jgi:hypothetical protein
MADDPRSMLQETVKGKSDDEIVQLLKDSGGVEQTLDMTFEGMKGKLKLQGDMMFAQQIQTMFDV